MSRDYCKWCGGVGCNCDEEMEKPLKKCSDCKLVPASGDCLDACDCACERSGEDHEA
jgi:hypothetical protein